MRRTLTRQRLATELLREPEATRWSYELARRCDLDRKSVSTILTHWSRQGWLTKFWEDNTMRGRPPRLYHKITDLGLEQLRLIVTTTDQKGEAS